MRESSRIKLKMKVLIIESFWNAFTNGRGYQLMKTKQSNIMKSKDIDYFSKSVENFCTIICLLRKNRYAMI